MWTQKEHLKAFSSRMKTVLNSIIECDQTVYVNGRYKAGVRSRGKQRALFANNKLDAKIDSMNETLINILKIVMKA